MDMLLQKIDGKYYDIGGQVSSKYIEDMGYYLVPGNQEQGYKVMKWLNEKVNLSVKPEKYIKE